MFSAVLFGIKRLKNSLERAELCEKRGQKRVRISDPFWGPFNIGTLSAGSKNAPIFGPEFGRRGTFTLELAFGIANLGGADQKSVPDAVR